jgi:hypothetical protein
MTNHRPRRPGPLEARPALGKRTPTPGQDHVPAPRVSPVPGVNRPAPSHWVAYAGAMLVLGVSLYAACTPRSSGSENTPQVAESSPEPRRSGDPPAKTSSVRFREVAQVSGLAFTHFNGATGGPLHMPWIMGSGVALVDLDGDGDLDVFAVQGDFIEPGRRMDEALMPIAVAGPRGSRLFLNERIPRGELRFRDVTADAGLVQEGAGMGVAAGDVDNDGLMDLFVTAYGPDRLYRNLGEGRFDVVPGPWETPAWSASASFADIDLDGDLDLFVTRYLDYDPVSAKRCRHVTGRPDFCSPDAYSGVSDRLYRNEGDGRFVDVSEAAGIDTVALPGLGAVVADFDGNGWPDIYVANDGKANNLWLDHGGAGFREYGLMSGAALNLDGRAEAGMGVAVADMDGDGDEDLFMTHLATETNTLYRNDGRGDFQDVTNEFRLGASSLPSTGFGVAWFDADGDGALDIYIANGAVGIEPDLVEVSAFPYAQSNLFYRRAGERFEKVVGVAGDAAVRQEISRGLAVGDVDLDGAPDLLVSNNAGPLRLLLNEGYEGSSLTVRLRGVKSNRAGLGARVALLDGTVITAWRTVRTDGSYLSASDAVAHFSGSALANAEHVCVVWPGMRRECWPLPSGEKVLLLREGTGLAWADSRD